MPSTNQQIVDNLVGEFEKVTALGTGPEIISRALEWRQIIDLVCTYYEGAKLPSAVANCHDEKTVTAFAAKQSRHSKAPCVNKNVYDMDFDDLAKAKAGGQKLEEMPRVIELPGFDTSDLVIPKISVAQVKGKEDKPWIALIRVENTYVPTWEMVGTENLIKRLEQDKPLTFDQRTLTTMSMVKGSYYVVLFKTVKDIVENRVPERSGTIKWQGTIPSIVSSKEMVTFTDAEVVRKDHTDSKDGKTYKKGDIKYLGKITVPATSIVWNNAVAKYIERGTAVRCTIQEPHDACFHPYVHLIDDPNTYFHVEDCFVRAVECVSNPGLERLRKGEYKHAKFHNPNSSHDPEQSTFIVTKPDAKKYPYVKFQRTQTLEEAENERKERSYASVTSRAKAALEEE